MTLGRSSGSLPHRQPSEGGKEGRVSLLRSGSPSGGSLGTPRGSDASSLSPLSAHSRSPRSVRDLDLDAEKQVGTTERGRTPPSSPLNRGTNTRILSPLPGPPVRRNSMSHVPGIEAPTSPKGSNHHGAETPPSASVDRRPVTPTLPAPVSSRLSPYSLVDRGPPASRLRASASALSSASAEGTSVDGKRPDGASPSLKNELLQSFAHMLLAMRSQRVAFGWQLSQVQRLVEQLAELPPAEGSLPSALPSSVVASLTGGDETLVTTHAEGTNETPLVAASAGTPCPATAGVRVEERAKQLHAGQPLPNAVTTIDMKRGVPHGNEPRKGESAGAANQEKPLALDASRGTGSDPKGRFFPGIPDGNSRLLAGSDVRTSVGPSTTRDEGSSFTASQLDPFSLFSSVPSSSRLELGVANLFHPGAVVSPQSRTSVEGAFADSSETLRREGIGSLLRSRQANGNDDALPEGKSISVTSLTDESAPVPQSVPFTASETGSAHGLAGPSVSLRRGSADLQSLERRIHGIRRAIELGMQFEDAYEMLTARRSPANSSEGGRLILDQAAREQRESPRHSINASKAVQAHAQDSVTASGVATRDSASVAGSETSRPLGLDDLTVVVTPARDSHKRRISSRIDAQLIAEESGKPPFQPSSHTPGAHWEGEETILAHPSVDRDRRSDTRKDAQRAAETARAHRRLQLDQPTVLREVLERRQRTLVRSERIRHLQSQMRVLETAREQMLAHERQMKARDSVGRRTDPEASRQAGQTSEASSGNACVMSSPSVAHVAHEQKPYEKREWAPNTGVAITPTGSLPLTRRRVQHPDERLLPPPQGESPSKGSPSDTVSDVPGGCPRFARGHTRARSQHTGTKGLLLYPTRFLADMMRDSVYELRHPRSPTDRATPLSRRLASQRPARVEQPPERHQGTPRSVSPDASLLSGILDTHPGSRSPNPNQFGSYRSDTYAGVPEALTHEWRAGSSRCRGAKSPAFIRSRESDRSEEDSRPPAGMPSPLRRGRFPGPPPPLRQIAGSATPARIVTRPPFGSDFNAAWMNERLFTSGDFYDYVPSQTNKTNSRGRSPSGQQHSRGVQVSWETDDVHAEDERDDFPVTEVDCYEGGSASIGVSWGGRIGAARDSRGKTQGVRETRESVGRLFSTQDRDVGDTQRVLTLRKSTGIVSPVRYCDSAVHRGPRCSIGAHPSTVEQYPSYFLYSTKESACGQEQSRFHRHCEIPGPKPRTVKTRTAADDGSTRNVNSSCSPRSAAMRGTPLRTAENAALRHPAPSATSCSGGAGPALKEASPRFTRLSMQPLFLSSVARRPGSSSCTREAAASQYPTVVDSVASLSWVKSLRSDHGDRNSTARSATPHRWRHPSSTPAPLAHAPLYAPSQIKAPPREQKKLKPPQLPLPSCSQRRDLSVRVSRSPSSTDGGKFALGRHERIKVGDDVDTRSQGRRKERVAQEVASVKKRSCDGDSALPDQRVTEASILQPVHVRLRVHIPPENGSNSRLAPPLTVRRLDPTTHKQFFERGQKYLNKLSLELPQDRTLMAVVSEGDVPVAVVRVRLTDDDSDPRAQ